MRKGWILVFVLATVFGTAMHFFYDWLPLPVVGLFAPVNESVWEHLKMLFWPFILSAVFLTQGAKDKHAAWSAFLAAALLQPLFVVAAFYTLKGALGVESLATDVALYVLDMAAGYLLAAELMENGEAKQSLGLLIVLAALYAACLVLFSIAAPGLPIFMVHS